MGQGTDASRRDDLYLKASAEFGPALDRLARAYEADPSQRLDLLQDIHFALWRSFSGFAEQCSLRTWVYRVAVNRSLRHCQRARPDGLPYDEQQEEADDHWQADPEQAAVKGELSDRVQDALGKLSPLHYDVVVMCEMHGMTYQECAAVLEIPVGTVKSRLSNAFRRLRISLGGYVFGDASAPCAEPVGEKAP